MDDELRIQLLSSWSLSIFRQKPVQLGPIDRASHYLRTPAPTQDKVYNINQSYLMLVLVSADSD
jgi:hypothetical protein